MPDDQIDVVAPRPEPVRLDAPPSPHELIPRGLFAGNAEDVAGVSPFTDGDAIGCASHVNNLGRTHA